MFAFRQFVIFSSSGVVIFFGGNVAIAQTTPLNTTANDSLEGQILLASVETIDPDLTPQVALNLKLAPKAAPHATVARPAALEQKLLANVGSLGLPQQKSPTPVTPALLGSLGTIQPHSANQVAIAPKAKSVTIQPELLSNTGVLSQPKTVAVVPQVESASAAVAVQPEFLGNTGVLSQPKTVAVVPQIESASVAVTIQPEFLGNTGVLSQPKTVAVVPQIESESQAIAAQDNTAKQVIFNFEPLPIESGDVALAAQKPPETVPILEPTAPPTLEPTAPPTLEPTVPPTLEPTAPPTLEPTAPPTLEPTASPTLEPTASPTLEPTAPPTLEPTASPNLEPTPPESNIPRVVPLAPERVVNTELQSLIEPLDNKTVSVPFDAAAVTTDNLVELTLEEAVKLALEHNETLQEARLTYERTKYQLREAIAAEYPSITSQTDIARTESASGELQAESLGVDESGVSSSLNINMELSYDIYTGGRRSGQIDATATQLKISELEIERLTEETRLNAATTYYDLQSADAQAVIEESGVFDANQSLKDAKLLEQAGLGTKFDVLRSQVEVANAEQRLTRAKASQKIARRKLAQILSLEPKIDPRTADEIALAGKWEMPLEDTIVLALQQRHELRQQLLQWEIYDYQQEIALADIRPNFSVYTNYNLLGVFHDNLGLADGLTLGARMRWNMFDGGAAAARVDQRQVDKAIAENKFVDQRNQIRLAVENVYYNLEASDANIKTASFAVTLADESLRLARLRFRAGVGTQTDVISAQTELNTARGNYLQAVTDYNRAFVQLKREVGLGDAVIAK